MSKKRKTIAWGAALLLAGSLLALLKFRPAPVDKRHALSLEQRLELACDLARHKYTNTLYYLTTTAEVGTDYPYITYQPVFSFKEWLRLKGWQKKRQHLPEGAWVTTNPGSWTAGGFPALLWKMPNCESEPASKKYWINQAKAWAEPLRELSASKEVTAGRTDGKVHWQAFIDHTINVEQLLWAAAHNPNPAEAKDWQQKAMRHLKTVAANSGERRHPGKKGTWQRGYFDNAPNSPTYGEFLFNEGKQGWTDGSTWSRGQAWFIYGSSIAYQYSGDGEIRQIAKSAIDYFLAHLPNRFPGRQRRPGDFIPPWDFDCALSQDPCPAGLSTAGKDSSLSLSR